MKPEYCRLSFITDSARVFNNAVTCKCLSPLVTCLHRSFCLQNPSLLFCPFTWNYPQGIPTPADFLLFQPLCLIVCTSLFFFKKILYHILLYIDLTLHGCILPLSQDSKLYVVEDQTSSLWLRLACYLVYGGYLAHVCRFPSLGSILLSYSSPIYWWAFSESVQRRQGQ